MDVSLTKVLKALSDQKTQKLFAAIIRAEAAKSQPLIGDSGLTRRQYYNRINDLLKTGLIRRHGGKYRLSSFGK
jgi:predicted transcriptional regulator